VAERTDRVAVVDLGSNSFRLVVFDSRPGRWWKRTDEIYDIVRLGAGVDKKGRLAEKAMDRAVQTLELYAHFCKATGIPKTRVRAVATSAIRDAANREEFLTRARRETGLDVEVLSREEEAFFGYLAATNSTTLRDGVVLDLGGGSMQAVCVKKRRATKLESWPLGAIRMTERFVPGDEASKKQLKALRKHVAAELERAPWLAGTGGRLVGLGGTVRNLADAAQRRAGLPSPSVQGFVLTAEGLEDLEGELASRPSHKRGGVPGIKPGRAEVILAGTAVLRAVLEVGDFDGIEVTEAGLREGVFLSGLLAPADPPLVPDVREASVRNLAAQYVDDLTHSEHVARLALRIWDSLQRAGTHSGDQDERELLRAAAMLHDVGMAIDYDDHHKHSRYLILSGGLPGFTPREVALVAQIARYHRKGEPSLGEFTPLTRDGDLALLRRCAALLRVVEQLERSREQLVSDVRVDARNGRVQLKLVGEGDLSVARWGARRQADVFEQAFSRELEVAA
jgi:exopolyphosphatase/guanosine-5'-triphosphate,3'-diphosphate pyrophosphatase